MKNNKMKNKLKNAFTLVELIIVIAVIAILSVIALPNFSGVLGGANSATVKSDTSNVKSVVAAYITEVGAVPVANRAVSANVIYNTYTSVNGTVTTSIPGVSYTEFKKIAKPNEYYLIDMDALARKQINIDDKTTVIDSKLGSIPSSSVVVDIASGKTPEDPYKNINDVKTNKRVKNTSVAYVIDSELNVYPAHSIAMRKDSLPFAKFTAANDWVILTDNPTPLVSDATGFKNVQNDTFKIGSYSVAGASIKDSLVVNDIMYN